MGKNNDQALHVIRLVCGYDALDRIKLCKTVKEAWDLLRSIFNEDLKIEPNIIKHGDFRNYIDMLHHAVKQG
jgi:hypothetical protein